MKQTATDFARGGFPMDYTGIALLVTAGGTFVAAVGGVIVSIRNSSRIEKVAEHVAKVETATNGMKDQLVQEVRKASRAEGVIEGKAEGHAS